MQTAGEVGKYVTDGKKVYPYNSYLDDLVANGTLHFCEKPSNVKQSPKSIYRSPVNYTADERLEFARKLGVTLGEITNMSPQEFEAALVSLEGERDQAVAAEVAAGAQTQTGFPA